MLFIYNQAHTQKRLYAGYCRGQSRKNIFGISELSLYVLIYKDSV